MLRFTNQFFSEPLWPLWHVAPLRDMSLSTSLHICPKPEVKIQEKYQSSNQKQNPQQDCKQSSMISENNQKNISIQDYEQFIQQLMKFHQMQEESLQSKQIDENIEVKVQYLSQPQYSQSQSSSGNTMKIKRKLSIKQIQGKYNILDKEIKKYLVKKSQKSSLAAVAKKYGISVNNLCRWKKSCQRRTGAGRKVNDIELEKRMIEWIKQETEKPIITLTRRSIQEKAKIWSNDQSFKASKGWLQRFAVRNRHLGLIELFGFRGPSISRANDQRASYKKR